MRTQTDFEGSLSGCWAARLKSGENRQKNDQPGELVIFQGEGISFLMGCSKNFIMYWGVTSIIIAQTMKKVCTKF